MGLKLVLLVAVGATLAPAQMTMSVEQLKSFIRSSIELRHDDRKLADYLHKVKLSQRLDERTVEELQGMGAGPKTVAALRELSVASLTLPPPPPPAPKTVATPIPGPDSIEQKRILAEVRDYALNYTKRLPDFICTQVTRRYIDPSGLEFWRNEDIITERLSYFEGKEDYKVILLNSQPVQNVAHHQLSGATSSGEFGSMLKEIFEPESQTEFAWERWGTLRARRMHVFSYRVSQARSKYRVIYQRSLDVVTGYHGLIYVDRDTLGVTRITLVADTLPADFPIQQISLDLNYDYVKIADNEYLLPLKAVLRSRQEKFLVKNEVEFHLYRKFGAEAVIKFDTPNPIPEEKLKETPPVQPKKPEKPLI